MQGSIFAQPKGCPEGFAPRTTYMDAGSFLECLEHEKMAQMTKRQESRFEPAFLLDRYCRKVTKMQESIFAQPKAARRVSGMDATNENGKAFWAFPSGG